MPKIEGCSSEKTAGSSIMTNISSNEELPSSDELSVVLSKAIKDKDVDTITKYLKSIVVNGDSEYMKSLCTKYAKENTQSLAYTLLNMPELANYKDLVSQLRTLCVSPSSGYNDFLAASLFVSLNASDGEKSKALIEKIQPRNVRNVAFFYDTVVAQTQEIAATKKEKEYLGIGKGLFEPIVRFLKMNSTPDTKINAKLPESLIQGVINQQGVSLEKRCENLEYILNCYIDNAKSAGVSSEKVSKFQTAVFGDNNSGSGLIDIIRDAGNDLSDQSTYYIEQELAELFRK